MTTIKREVILRDRVLSLERGAAAALILLAATLAFESVRPLLSLGGVVLTNVEAVLFLTIGLWLLACAAARRRPHVPGTVALPAVAWLATLLIAALVAPGHRLDALKFVGRMIGGVLVAWATTDLCRAPGRWTKVNRALALGGLAVGLFGLAEALDLPLVDRFLAAFKHGPTMVGEVLRVSSTLVYATIASMILELSAPLLLAWLLTTERRWGRAVLGLGLAATLAAQALTLTRGGLIALLAGLGFMAAWAGWRHSRPVLVGSLATGGMLLALWAVFLLSNPITRYRLVSETEQSWYQAVYQAPPRLTAMPGETVRVRLTLTNTGMRPWQAGVDHPFELSYHLVRRDGTSVQFDGRRFPLPHDVPPGTDLEMQALLTAPAVAGEYVVEWDMLQEGVTWFSLEGTAPAQTLLTVAGTEVAGAGDTLPADVDPRLSTVATAEAPGRLWLWQVAAGMVLERPLFGVGPDNFRWLYATYARLEQADVRIHTNNLYVEWLVDTGIVGFAVLMWLTWRLARAAYGRLREEKRSKSETIWQVALIASLVTWFVHGAFDFFYEFTPTYLAFALLCGLALAKSPLSIEEGRPCASDST